MKIVQKYYFILASIITFFIYLFTLAPSVIQIDTGELAAVQALLGIAHPTGYPIFTIVGFLFSKIPLPFSIIYKLNILAAIWCSLGVMFFILSARLVLDNLNSFQKLKIVQLKISKKKKIKGQKEEPKKVDATTTDIPEITKILSTLAGGFILAFNKTFWVQSTSVEVYSLHIFLIMLIIYFLLKAFLTVEKQNFAWLFVAIALTFGFANHMTTLLILPGIAYLFFMKNKFNKGAFVQIGKMLLIFFPLLIFFYSYLPIRAAQNPLLNWGNPIDMERILRHISGKQYQVWLFSSMDSAKKQLDYFINSLTDEYNIALIIIAFGIIGSIIRARKFFVFTSIVFLFTIFYSINYDINDIDSYFLLAYISLAFFAVFGFLKLFLILRDKHLHFSLPIILLVVFIFIQTFITYEKVSQSGNYIYEDYCKAVLKSCDKNSVVFSYQWDFFVSSSYYFNYVEGYRNDIAVIDKELLRRSWYINELKNNYPKVVDKINITSEQFLEALKPFERSENYNSNMLENLYRKIMTELVETNIDERTFYVGPELFENEMQKGEFILPKGLNLIPDLFFFKVIRGNEYQKAAAPNFNLRFPKQKNKYTDFIENTVASMLTRRAMYEMQFDKRDRAKLYIQKVKNDFPNYPLPNGLIEALEK